MFRRGLIFYLVSCGFTPWVWARWMRADEFDVREDSRHIQVHVKKDGRFVRLTESRKTILSENGVKESARFPIRYNSGRYRIKVLKAYTLNGNQKSVVTKKQIDEKPVDAGPEGFDSMHVIRIAYPNLRVGSQTYLKFQLELKKSWIPGHFSEFLFFGWGENLQKAKVDLTSEKELYFQFNDPKKNLDFTKSQKGKAFNYQIQLKQPIHNAVMDEEASSIDPHLYTWLTATTDKNWQNITQNFTRDYEEVLSADLPERFLKIVKKAQKEKDPVQKMSVLMNDLITEVKYLGDWRTIKGQLVARPLDQIAKTGYGDCKDYSVLLAKMLRALGFKAHVSLIRRTAEYPYRQEKFLPNTWMFNHAIVKAQWEKTTYWVDATNYVVGPQYVFYDISQRPVLVLDNKSPYLEKTTMTPWSKAGVAEHDLDVEYQSNGDRKVDYTFKINGLIAKPFFERVLVYRSDFLRTMISIVADVRQVRSSKMVKRPQPSSRILSPLNTQSQFELKGVDFRTSLGPATRLAYSPALRGFLHSPIERVSDLHLGQPGSSVWTHRLKNVRFKGSLKKLSCSLKSPWLDFQRSIRKVRRGIQVMDQVHVKTHLVLSRDLHSSAFKALQDKLDQCIDNIAYIYSWEQK